MSVLQVFFNTCYWHVFKFNHSRWCIVTSHVFNLMNGDIENLFMLLLAINVSTFGDMSIKIFAYFYLSSKISYYWGYWVQVFWGPVPAGSRGTLRMNGVSERETQWDKTRGLSLKFIFTLPLYTLNNIFFGGSAYCLHTGNLKTLQQLDLKQKQDVIHIFFIYKNLLYHLAFRPANILWFAPGVT